MARYKVPQDVEADDKLIGPFGFRQFVYLLITGALIAIGVGLFQIFPFLIIIVVPPILFFAALALPLKKDQPMETYLAAVASYYLKPKNRRWIPGQKDFTIEISAPKMVDDSRARDITSEEATHRLSFLADIVDTEGYAIKSGGYNHVNMQLVEEANRTRDMFEVNDFGRLDHAITQDENQRYEDAIRGMQDEILKKTEAKTRERNEVLNEVKNSLEGVGSEFDPSVVVVPDVLVEQEPVENSQQLVQDKRGREQTKKPNPSIIELANNADYTVATIAKEANRINERDGGEVFISLR